MAVRLSVIYSSPRGGTAAQQSLEGDLVAQLIGEPGIDLNIIGPLERLPEEATDRLLLEGISGDFAFLGWQSPEKTSQVLTDLQMPGMRGAHRLDPAAAELARDTAAQPASIGRRWYLVDLSQWDCEQIVAGLRGILASRRVSTVTLGGGVEKSPAASVSQKKVTNEAAAPAVVFPPVEVSDNSRSVREGADDLDALMDDLDAWDQR